MDGECYVYAFGVNGDFPGLEQATKIGIATNPESRLFGCQTGSPVRLYIQKTWKFDTRAEAQAFETACHQEFADRLIHREWFTVTVEEIQKLRAEFYAASEAQEEIAELRRMIEIGEAKPRHDKRLAKLESAPLPSGKPIGKKDLLLTAEAAAYIQRSASWLNKSRMTGSGPVYMKLGGGVRYKVADLDAWLDSQRRVGVYAHANKMPA